MSSYITTTVRTLRPLVCTRPAEFRFRSHERENASIERRCNRQARIIVKPLYETEREVTLALLAGTLVGLSSVAYANAKAYQVAVAKK